MKRNFQLLFQDNLESSTTTLQGTVLNDRRPKSEVGRPESEDRSSNPQTIITDQAESLWSGVDF